MFRGGKIAAVLLTVIVIAGGTSGCEDWPRPEFFGSGDRERAGVEAGQGDFRGTVVAQAGLNVRESPTTQSDVVGGLTPGASIMFDCKELGQAVDGNPRWYRLDTRHWVAARYVDNVGAIPSWCP